MDERDASKSGESGSNLNAVLRFVPVTSFCGGGLGRAMLLSVCLAFFSFPALVHSQSPDAFNPGANSEVHALAVQTDGKILVGGDFTMLGGQARNLIGRLNPDGTLDSGFNPQADGTVRSMAIQPDGKIVVVGSFSNLGGQTRFRIARLNADGTLDTTFNPIANDTIGSVALQPDGRILVGGSFTILNGQFRYGIARFNSDGSLDLSFFAGHGTGILAEQSDGKILLGDSAGLGRVNAADGSPDAAFVPIYFWDVNSLVVQPDGKILVGTGCDFLSGQQCRCITRINNDGSLDNSFLGTADDAITSLALQTDGKILVAGLFYTLDAVQPSFLGRLNADGTSDTNFSVAPDGPIDALAVQPDGSILLGGVFSALAGQLRANIGRLTNTAPATQNLTFDGAIINWMRGGTSPEVWSTSFEASTNGNDWIDLGAGTRVTGGWKITGISYPLNTTFRARGIVAANIGSSWSVESTIGQPVVDTQAVSRTNLAGTIATFGVIAGSTPPFAYQWLKDGLALNNGGNIIGARASMLTVSNVLGADAGGYSVIVSNASGSVTSRVAVLDVIDPFIGVQPQSVWTNAGNPVQFSVVASGTAPLRYQWRKNSGNLLGATTSSLILTNVQVVDAGGYDVVVTNVFGVTTSSVATLAVNLATTDSFDPGADGPVYSLVVQPDGRILAGGGFTQIGGSIRGHIARLNSNGTVDLTFDPGANDLIDALAVQADGKLLVGGNFTTLAGQTCGYVGRLDSYGTLDTTFNPDADGDVYSLVVQGDGKILVGGEFMSLGGQTNNYMGRLNTNGAVDSAFNPAPNGPVRAQCLQPDGKILVGGGFTTLNGQPRSHIGRLNIDGSLDTTFDPAADGEVNAIALQRDGKILVGGRFATLHGQLRNHLGRLNPDGTADGAFNPGADDDVLYLTIQVDGKILAGGYFQSLGLEGLECPYLGRLNTDGTLDQAFAPEADGFASCLVVQPDGKVLTGGNFKTLAAQPRQGIGRLTNTDVAMQQLSFDASTITWARSGAGPEFWRSSFEVSTNALDWAILGAGTRIVEGWQLTNVSVPSNASIRGRGWAVNGGDSSWYVETIAGGLAISLQPLSQTNNAGTVAEFHVLAGGVSPLNLQWVHNGAALVDGGSISGAQTSSLTLSNLARADAGAYWITITNRSGSVTSAVATLSVIDPFISSHPTNQFANVNQSVAFTVTAAGTSPLGYQWRKNGATLAGATAQSLLVNTVQQVDQGSYDVVVSNQFGRLTSIVATLTVNLSPPDSFNPGPDSAIRTISVQADGKILIGGDFTLLDGQARNHIGRLNEDGTVDSTFNPGANRSVYTLAVQPDSKIVVGGFFSTLAGQTRTRIARLYSDGTLDTNFNPGASSSIVYSLALQADGKIVLGGGFTLLHDQLTSHIGRLDEDGTPDPTFNPGADTNVYALAIQSDGKILAGGGFVLLGGQPRSGLGRLNPDGVLDANFDPGANGSVYALAVQGDEKILVGGNFTMLGGQPRNHIGRLNKDGTLDLNFDPNADDQVNSLAIQADGRILVGGLFQTVAGINTYSLCRLNADGSPDTTFLPGTDGYVSSIVLQPDGKVLVGGAFSTLAAQTRSGLGRLNGTESATQGLAAGNAGINWIRSGATPEVWRTTFEISQNGTDFTSLGDGTRFPGGWQIIGAVAPANSVIRARGFVAGACQGASWFVEDTLRIGPMLAAKNWSSNEFGVNIRALPGDILVIEASTNMVNWVPVQTNGASVTGDVIFDDVESGSLSRRFYRVRLY